MLHSIEMVEMPQPAQGLPKIAKKGRSGGRVLRSRSRAPFFFWREKSRAPVVFSIGEEVETT